MGSNRLMFRVAGLFMALGWLMALWAISAEAKSFLWEVSAKNGGRAYILGSIHLAEASLYPLNNDITRAFDQAGLLVVEINSEAIPPATMANYIMNKGVSPEARPLLERLTPETASLLADSGYYNQGLADLKPWLAALMIQMEALQKNGFDPALGIDKHFLELAVARGLVIFELETLEDQMDYLVDLSDNEADIFLRAALAEMNDLPQTMKLFLDSWRGGETKRFAEVFFKEYDQYPELVPLLDKMIFQRNELMAAKINDLLNRESRVLFVVVGAGHLVGDRSILSKLAAWGHGVRQL